MARVARRLWTCYKSGMNDAILVNAALPTGPVPYDADRFWIAGFECASHRRKDGVQLDLIRATGHDKFALADYRACRAKGFYTARDGLRWHRIEQSRGAYDWSSWLPMLEAAEEAGLKVIWDLCHYGWPRSIDPLGEDFIPAFAAFAAAAVRVHQAVTGQPMRVCPINEVNFLTWAMEVGYIKPSLKGKPLGWMKRRLVLAAIAAEAAMRDAAPGNHLTWAEPLIRVPPPNRNAAVLRRANILHESQFQAFDMLLGRLAPELGGHDGMIDSIGLNYYPSNQWYSTGGPIPMGHHEYRPLSELLVDYHARYGKPMFIAETGAESSARASWLHYVCQEVRVAMRAGVPVQGICLYPVTDYPGWDDSRRCPVGLFGYADAAGHRPVDEQFAAEVERQQGLFAAMTISP